METKKHEKLFFYVTQFIIFTVCDFSSFFLGRKNLPWKK